MTHGGTEPAADHGRDVRLKDDGVAARTSISAT